MVTLEQLSPEPPEEPNTEPRFISVDEAASVLDRLACDVPREMLSNLAKEPMTASELAEDVGTTLQNASYHLDHLHDAGLISVVGSRYSSRGHEMNIYASNAGSIVIFLEEDMEHDVDSLDDISTEVTTELS